MQRRATSEVGVNPCCAVKPAIISTHFQERSVGPTDNTASNFNIRIVEEIKILG